MKLTYNQYKQAIALKTENFDIFEKLSKLELRLENINELLNGEEKINQSVFAVHSENYAYFIELNLNDELTMVVLKKLKEEIQKEINGIINQYFEKEE